MAAGLAAAAAAAASATIFFGDLLRLTPFPGGDAKLSPSRLEVADAELLPRVDLHMCIGCWKKGARKRRRVKRTLFKKKGNEQQPKQGVCVRAT